MLDVYVSVNHSNKYYILGYAIENKNILEYEYRTLDHYKYSLFQEIIDKVIEKNKKDKIRFIIGLKEVHKWLIKRNPFLKIDLDKNEKIENCFKALVNDYRKKEESKMNKPSVITTGIYVDGSYNKSTGYYGWGYVVVEDGIITDSYSGSDNVANEIWSVAGELTATMNAIGHAYERNNLNITIVYDYIGIEKWANSEWKAKNKWTIQYKSFVARYRKLGMIINFQKVKGHSGNEYNDMADRLANNACYGGT